MSELCIHLIAAARPNFMKIAPLFHALRRAGEWAQPHIVHTGQHYDVSMSDSFFRDLSLPDPNYHLGVGSGSHAEQTGRVMMAYDALLNQASPGVVVVVGDVNSTLACSLVAAKRHIPVAHLEAGLRSGDRSMPEEINRIVTDSISDVLWTPSEDGDVNLLREGVPASKIERVGNIMIDSLEMVRPAIMAHDLTGFDGLEPGSYGLVTLHRPSNVDDKEKLSALLRALAALSERYPLVFPVHPRTAKNIQSFGVDSIVSNARRLLLCPPQPYTSFMRLLFGSRFVVTDSGGLQEETSYLGIPCLTLRDNTERPVTISLGTNRLSRVERLLEDVEAQIRSTETEKRSIPLWDGKTAPRVVESLRKRFL